MKYYLLVLFLSLSTLVQAQSQSYQLSTHILDINTGKPAEKVTVQLEKQNEATEKWISVGQKVTNSKGRINNFLPSDSNNKGIYKLTFLVKDYFKKQQVDTFYPFIEVVFEIKSDSHYHVPITLSPYGYSTYRGS